jgi:Cof subfamily protein (haloacid dehalogenase superfamily)
MTDHPKAVLCLDIDGTLIDEAEKMHPLDVQGLRQLPRQIQPVFTTGRILHSAKGVLQKNGLFPETRLPWPGVFMNGGAAFLPDETLCLAQPFESHTRKALIELANAFPETAFTFFSVDAVFVLNPNPFAAEISKRHYLSAREADGDAIPDEVIKVMVLEPEAEKLAQIESQARTLQAEMAYSLTYAYEINPPGVTKAGSLKTLLAAMDLDSLPVYAVGDAENDLALFEAALASFAPDSAHPRVTSRATMVIPRAESGMIQPVLDFLSVTGTI